MRSLLRVSSSLLCVLALAAAVGCKQGEGERCQTDDDCEEGLTCSFTSSPPKCLPTAPTTDDAAVFDMAVPPVDVLAPPIDAGGVDVIPPPPDAGPPDAMP
jgi:hypothetical protein